MSNPLNRNLGTVAAFWGMFGVCGVLLYAVWRMLGHVQEGFLHSFEVSHYALMIPWLFFMAYSEGYKGFQKSFSPRVAARACFLKDNSTWLRALLAPIFCMGFFDSTRKRKIVIWVLLVMVTAFVILFQYISQPWRGILDLGVVVGLSWGVAATLIYFFRYWFGTESGDPEIPEASANAKI